MKKVVLSILCIALMSCSGLEKKSENKIKNKPLEISIIHINDHHSHLEESSAKLKVNGKSVGIKVGGMDRVSDQINEFRKTSKNPLVLHAGDSITGTLYFTLFKGSSDAEIMNYINFDAFTLGNHEFDAQNEGLKFLLDQLKIPVISANVVADSNSILNNKWKPYIIKEIEGQPVGIIGIDVSKKTQLSSSPGKDIKFYDEIETTRKYVKELEDKGVNKIIVLSHAGTGKNLEIAKEVSGVDVVVSGDWHSLFADDSVKALGLPVSYNYPTKVMTPRNEPAYVVEGWEYGKFVGNLGVLFDENGIITDVKPNAKIVVSDEFFELRDENNKKYQAKDKEKDDIIRVLKENKYISFPKQDSEAKKIIEKYKKEKDLLSKQIVGKIVGESMPGGSQNRIPAIPGAHPQGSIATRFIAETMLEQIRTMGSGNIDFTIQNSGGVRTDIVSGDITYNDAYTYLPFGNTLYLLAIKGSEVKQMLEEALEYALTQESTGAFPYGAAIRYEAVEGQEFGKRVKSIQIQDRVTKAWLPVEMDKEYIMGTNAYIAAGRDGYFILGKITQDPSRYHEDTYLPDAESFIKFLKEHPNFESYTTSNVKFTPNKYKTE